MIYWNGIFLYNSRRRARRLLSGLVNSCIYLYVNRVDMLRPKMARQFWCLPMKFAFFVWIKKKSNHCIGALFVSWGEWKRNFFFDSIFFAVCFITIIMMHGLWFVFCSKAKEQQRRRILRATTRNNFRSEKDDFGRRNSFISTNHVWNECRSLYFAGPGIYVCDRGGQRKMKILRRKERNISIWHRNGNCNHERERARKRRYAKCLSHDEFELSWVESVRMFICSVFRFSSLHTWLGLSSTSVRALFPSIISFHICDAFDLHLFVIASRTTCWASGWVCVYSYAVHSNWNGWKREKKKKFVLPLNRTCSVR